VSKWLLCLHSVQSRWPPSRTKTAIPTKPTLPSFEKPSPEQPTEPPLLGQYHHRLLNYFFFKKLGGGGGHGPYRPPLPLSLIDKFFPHFILLESYSHLFKRQCLFSIQQYHNQVIIHRGKQCQQMFRFIFFFNLHSKVQQICIQHVKLVEVFQQICIFLYL
jgi:hypothetical protein